MCRLIRLFDLSSSRVGVLLELFVIALPTCKNGSTSEYLSTRFGLCILPVRVKRGSRSVPFQASWPKQHHGTLLFWRRKKKINVLHTRNAQQQKEKDLLKTCKKTPFKSLMKLAPQTTSTEPPQQLPNFFFLKKKAALHLCRTPSTEQQV